MATIEELEQTIEALKKRTALVEAQQGLQTQTLLKILEGNWTRQMPHAAALLVALMGGQEPAGFAPIDLLEAIGGELGATPSDWEPIDVRGKLATSDEGDYGWRDPGGIFGSTVHYTAGPPTSTVEAIARYQTSEAARGQPGPGLVFPGFAYTMGVEEDGDVKLAWDLSVRVWHSAAVVGGRGRNYTHMGIVFMGSGSPNAAQIVGLGRGIAWGQRQLGRPLEIEGHNTVYATGCPGPGYPGWRPQLLAAIR